MQGRIPALLCGLIMMGMAGAAKAIVVDLELSLVIDSSDSIDDSEFSRQIDGYAAAFRLSPVVDSIVNSTDGIAVNAILFADAASVAVPFTQLQTEADVAGFAAALEAIDRINGFTDIAAGINLAVETIAFNPFDSGDIIIDVSGDGEQNLPGDPAASRDAALTAGISRINGLAIGGTDILDFYQANVIGGLDAFALQAIDFEGFSTAIANKIRVEVGAPPVDVPEPGTIGLIGLGVITLGLAMRRRQLCSKTGF